MKHEVLISLFLALFILTLIGVGNALIVGMLGLLLCMMGLMQNNAKVDLWIFIPLIVYFLISVVSSYNASGDIGYGYESTQVIFPIIYLLLACIDKKEQFLLKMLCIAWAEGVAIIGISQFSYRAATQGAIRLGGFLGNPNAMGIFLVLSWIALINIPKEDGSWKSCVLWHLEPFLLIAIALTLSMESFLSMAIGLLVLLIGKKRKISLRETFCYACRMLAKPVLGFGIGILMYLAADRTDMPWLCFPLLFYAVAVCICWRKFEAFLEQYQNMATIISAVGLLVAATAIALRPNAVATFLERLEMMRNGLRYFKESPLLGIGPYQWRIRNLYDSDKYFNTWFIHNAFIHIGVELGLIALAMVLIVVIRFYRTRKDSVLMAVFSAFLFHNLMDTSAFYLGITAMLLLLVGTSPDNRRKVGGVGLKIIFGAFAVFLLFNLYRYRQLS